MVPFNRYPTLATAIFVRRTLGLMAAAYFDDNLLVDIASSAQRAKDMLCWAFSTFGMPPKAAKAFPMQSHRAFLGAVLDLAEVTTEGPSQ